MAKRTLMLVLVASILAAGIGAATEVFTGPPVSPTEAFAVWPEDTSQEAEEECASGPSWRRSLDETVLAFAKRVGIKGRIDVEGGIEGSSETGGVEIYGPNIPLNHSVQVRRAYGCWYVTHIINREDYGPSIHPAYAGEPPHREMFLYIPPFEESPLKHNETLGSFGSGRAEVSLDGLQPFAQGTLLTVPANDDLPGHFILAARQTLDQSPGAPYATTVSSPPNPEGSVEIPAPETIKAAWEADVEESNCKGWWRESYSPEAAARFSLSRPKNLADVEEKTVLEPLTNSDYLVKLNNLTLKADQWKTGKCNALGHVAPIKETPEDIERIRVNEEGFFFDLEWGRATSAYVEYGFGGISGSAEVPPVRNPLSFPQEVSFPTSRPGVYRVAFWNHDGMLSLYEGALPPLEWVQDHARR